MLGSLALLCCHLPKSAVQLERVLKSSEQISEQKGKYSLSLKKLTSLGLF